jgi:hypothetical protein
MTNLRLTDLIGSSVRELRFHYTPKNEYQMQEYHAYLRLSNDQVIPFPKFTEDDSLRFTETKISYFKKIFEKAAPLSIINQKKIEGTHIEDLYFAYNHNLPKKESKAYLKLDNGYYLTECNYGPQGLTDIGLHVLNEKQFQDRIGKLMENVKSYLHQIRNGL